MERKKLLQAEPITLVEYIQTSIEILMQLKTEEARRLQEKKGVIKSKIGSKKELPDFEESPREDESKEDGEDKLPAEYEKLLVKLEGEVRTHIKVEQ